MKLQYCSRIIRGWLASHYQQIWSKIKKKYINFRYHQNRAIDSIFNETSSNSALKTYFCNNQKILFHPVTANFSASKCPIFVFLSCPEVSGNHQKPKRNCMAADDRNKNFQGLASFWNIFSMIFVFKRFSIKFCILKSNWSIFWV